MGARVRVFLNKEENRTLWERRTASTVAQRVKDRAEAVRLIHQGLYVEKIAEHFNWSIGTVRKTLKRWIEKGLGGLWDSPGRGREARWKEEDIEHLEKSLREDERTYNSHQLAEKLLKERQVKLSPDHLRQVLKKRG